MSLTAFLEAKLFTKWLHSNTGKEPVPDTFSIFITRKALRAINYFRYRMIYKGEL